MDVLQEILGCTWQKKPTQNSSITNLFINMIKRDRDGVSSGSLLESPMQMIWLLWILKTESYWVCFWHCWTSPIARRWSAQLRLWHLGLQWGGWCIIILIPVRTTQKGVHYMKRFKANECIQYRVKFICVCMCIYNINILSH